MSLNIPKDFRSAIPPFINMDNRNEHFLIEAAGTFFPECEEIFYGLCATEYAEMLPKLRDSVNISNVRKMYYDLAYFNGPALVRYLADDPNLDDMTVKMLLDAAHAQYRYMPCGETAMRHSLIEAMYADYVKSVTLIYPYAIRELDVAYLYDILPSAVVDKVHIEHGNILDYTKENPDNIPGFTTVVLNSLSDLHYLIDNNKIHNVSTASFLLRNNSENCIMSKSTSDKDQYTFTEVGNAELLTKLVDTKYGIPLSEMRYGRFEPILFSDIKTEPKII